MFAQEMVEQGLSLVRGDQQHDLKVAFRCRLLSSFDEMPGGVGRRRRTKLAALAVANVLPLWESFLPVDDTPRRALDLAEKVLAGTVVSTVAENEMGELWMHCDELSYSFTERQSVIMVGYGAIQTLREALSEKHFGCERLSDESTDMDVDPSDHDSSFCAVTAYSGGPSWEKSSDAGKRLEFWTWWLTTAVRTAMTVA